MALDATAVQHGRHVAGVGDLGVLQRLVDPTDETARGFGYRLADLFAGQHFFDSLRQVFASGRVALAADHVLVVDATPIAHHTVLVEQEDFRCAHGAQLVGHHVAHVFQQRKVERVALGIGRHLGERVLLVGVDRQKGHAGIGEPIGQLHQPRSVELGQRALGA